ncbi:hypothetical protein L0U85_07565 [Glycomyces sp. L485]|uniref:hypothetical protein n=1 Tax=Glycomyces sp. L485 TaxID=2909235 RepID=UPI001F4A8057|nr:hypothetical protein [Glycomyces sp. L485]MCH7230707.1 hypothetical protein [Glycomyces sp. L485]
MDVAALASRLRALAADLPGPGIDTADAHLESSLAEIKDASRESNTEVGARRLLAAREHLGSARTRLAEASTAVDDYLDAIGAGAAPAAPTAAPAAAPARAAPVDPRRWWTDRVNELCRRSGTAANDTTSPTRLFNELLRAAADGSAVTYHERLRDAGPETGVKLPGLAWPLVRTLAAEHLGRNPTARDVPTLRDRTADRVRSLVPGLEAAHIETAIASACTLGPPKHHGDETGDAAATAAVGPALVAALHRLAKTERKART